MPETVWINGNFVDRASAKVSAFDAGFQHAVGLFETMLATQGRVFRIDRHLARLAHSAAELGLSPSIKTRPLAEIVEAVVGASQLAEGNARARVRLTMTGGDLNLLRPGSSGGGGGGATTSIDPTLMIVVSPATEYPEEMFSKGIGVLVPSARASRHDPGAGHKAVNYWWRLLALRQAAGVGMGECLVLSDTNHVCGGAVSNVFIVRDGVIMTPFARGEEGDGAPVSPVLPGVTRAVVMESAASAAIPCERRVLDIRQVLEAEEVFLTNSGWGVLPVVRVEGHVVGGGQPGRVTAKLRSMWLSATRDEL